MWNWSKCSVCQRPDQVLAAIDQALRDGVPLSKLSGATGIPKSTLGKHSLHTEGVPRYPRPQKGVPIVQKNDISVPAPSKPAVLARQPLLDREAARAKAEERLETLFNEAMGGLEASKNPIVVSKSLTLPPDLRARASFIRAGASIVDSSAKLNGLYLDQAALPTNNAYNLVILLPKAEHVEQSLPKGPVVDAIAESSE